MLVAEFVTGAGVGTVGRMLSWLLWLVDGLWAGSSVGYLGWRMDCGPAAQAVTCMGWWRVCGLVAQLVTRFGGGAMGQVLNWLHGLVDGLRVGCSVRFLSWWMACRLVA